MAGLAPEETPLQAALALYTPEVGRTFMDDLAAFAATGHVFITARAVLLGKAVPTGLADYSDPWARYEEETCDAWLVWLAAGDMRECLRLAPHPKKHLGFARQGRMRWYRYDDITKRIVGGGALRNES